MSKKWRVSYWMADAFDLAAGFRIWRPSQRHRGHRFFSAMRAQQYITGRGPIGYRLFIHRVGKVPKTMAEFSLYDNTPLKGETTVAQKTFHIELRCVNVDDPVKFEALKKAAQGAARILHAQAMLVCASDSPPQILIYGEDFISGKKEIEAGTADEDEA